MQPPAAEALLPTAGTMSDRPFRLQVNLDATPRAIRWLAGVNLALTFTTGLFIVLWARMESVGETTRWMVRYLLVQGHLATENVLAAWYSSMLLLTVGVLAVAAWSIDTRQDGRRWRHGWLVVAAAFLTLSVDEIGSMHERIGMVAQLSPSGSGPAGWVYVLLVPILAVALFLFGFAWLHLRPTGRPAWLMAWGVILFLLNPAVEKAEMALIHGGGAAPGSWQQHLHDVLLVLEEGGLELFGSLLFIAAVAAYLERRGGKQIEWLPRRGQISVVLWVGIGLGVCGARLAPEITARLPEGDTGILQNWFPAAAWALVSVAAWPLSRRMAAGALAVSGMFGAGLYLYVDVLASSAAWKVPAAGVLLAGMALEALVTWRYRLMRSPMSSIASPSLRRPRPNPS